MSEKIILNDSMLYRSHPWHVSLGNDSPDVVNCYIEIVPTDTIKYELDKSTGLLKVDRPQRYSSLCPTLYGLLPQTYAGPLTAEFCRKKTGLKNIVGDNDPLDVCVLTEKVIPRGDIMLKARPIGGFRMIDGSESDDKLIAVLIGDFVYEQYHDLSECPEKLIERLRHYFLTYKDAPERDNSKVQIVDIYGRDEALQIINLGHQDYHNKFCRG